MQILLEQLKKKKKILEENKKGLDDKITNLKVFEKFLQKVLENSNEFSDDQKQDKKVSCILDRYSQLLQMQDKFTQSKTINEDKKDTVVNQVRQLKEHLQKEQINQNVEVNKKLEAIEKMEESNRKLQNKYESKITQNNVKLTNYGWIILSIKNLYHNQIYRNKEDAKNKINVYPELDKDPFSLVKESEVDSTKDILTRLDWIQQRLSYLQKVKTEYKKQQQEN